MRPNCYRLTAQPTHLALDRTLAQPALLPSTAGRLLPYRFTHHPATLYSVVWAGLLSVAVVVKDAFQHFALTYCFVRRSASNTGYVEAESREVPLPNYSSWAATAPFIFINGTDLKDQDTPGVHFRRPRQDSNLRPFGPQPNALSTELRRRVKAQKLLNPIFNFTRQKRDSKSRISRLLRI
jgi:hypothetical protein